MNKKNSLRRTMDILIVLALVLLVTNEWQDTHAKEPIMAIEFPNGSSLSFGTTPAAVSDATSRTWMAWINITAQQTQNYPHMIFLAMDVPGGWAAWELLYYSNTNKVPPTYFRFARDYTVSGSWQGTANLTIGVWYHVAVTYAEGLDNDPVIYLNGAAVETTEQGAPPSGTVGDDSDSLLYLGGISTYNPYSKIIIADARIYNRILSAAEIAEICAARSMDNVLPGLIFQVRGLSAAGLQTFDGATLGGSNLIVDRISGAVGTPQGSPVGRADAMLSCMP